MLADHRGEEARDSDRPALPRFGRPDDDRAADLAQGLDDVDRGREHVDGASRSAQSSPARNPP